MTRRIVAFVPVSLSNDEYTLNQSIQDVIGTLFDFEGISPAIQDAFGPLLDQNGITARHVSMMWYYAAQRDFTYASLSGSYAPIANVFKATLPRTIKMVCGPDVELASEDIDAVCSRLPTLPPRPELQECMSKLDTAGFEIWLVSNGATKSTRALVENSRLEIRSLEERIISCDSYKVAKPDPKLYQEFKQEARLDSADSHWFVAAHAWDLLAARQVGFKTAYLTSEEHDATESIFGTPDIQADSLSELASHIINES